MIAFPALIPSYEGIQTPEYLQAWGPVLQADSDPLIQVLPTTGVTVSVSFYNTAAHKLAAEHAIIRALLQVCPQQRKGCYTAATMDLMNAASMPAAMVRLN